ncbi:MAG: DUF4062 domain-containing protein [Candidatus Omnitrophica bacterium]|nr:DUF4062 domain-containing protein [Candidatus Omnitrophota bacterium]
MLQYRIMQKYRIFISAVQKELKEERRAVKSFIQNNFLLKDHFEVFLFEDAPAKSKPSQEAYLSKVGGSDIYIGILGQQYGLAGKGKISPTEMEFRAAQKAKKEILVYIKGENGGNDKKREVGVRRLIKEIKDPQRGYTYKRFKIIDELTSYVFESLVTFLRSEGVVGRGDFDERVCRGATFDDIDEPKVRWFLRVAKAERNYAVKIDAPLKDVFIHLDLLKDGQLTNAAILLFGKKPHRFFIQAEMKCIQLPGTQFGKPFSSYQIYDGNLFEQIDRALAFVLSSIKFPVEHQTGTAQFKRYFEIPEFSIKEALVNAASHRNYDRPSGIQVMVFIDRVEIWNSGGLPHELTVEKLKVTHPSYPANPLIANALFLAAYAQRAGTGTTDMIKACREQGTPEPQFDVYRNLEFKTILPRDIFTEDVLQRMDLNERQVRAIKFIKEHGKITNKEYSQLSKVVDRTALRDLKDLCEKSLLKKVGTTGRDTRYVLSRHKPDKPDILKNPT